MNLKTIKKQAWDVFSKYIRYRDCVATTGSIERGKCCSCGLTYEFSLLQAGHYIDGRNNYLLFNEDFTNSQCMSCNIERNGNKDNYRAYLVRKLGLHKVQEFEDNHSKETMIEGYQFQEIKDYYKQKIKELLNEK